MYHSVPRTTIDIDIILKIDDHLIPPFVDHLNSNGFRASVPDLRAGLNESSHTTFFFKDTLLRLDIQGVNSEFDQMTLDRAVEIDIFGTLVKMGSIEDTFVNKILFQGETDLRDALGIIARHEEDLDWEYIRSTCDTLEIGNLLVDFLAYYDSLKS